MKKILILVLSAIFLLGGCQNKTENILINIRYIGNYDRAMDIFLSNYKPNIKIDNAYQSIYEVKNEKVLEEVEKYIIKNQSEKTYRTNKLKVTIIKNKKAEIFFFNSEKGINFIDYLIENIKVKNSETNKYKTNQYFIESELPPFRNQLKVYSGREWMNEEK
ncbi:hypothetical protein [Chryseobacterium vrystaatense]|uniref:Lipoprotein n=1 Tax=Chryseobacterium vrystaatense TaxID=307480 RepID=A0A1M4VXT6_9FLAO|nr:hypothetical protein [Chryseobacterium vrystaatense]SHE73725.1 hypothetical protein SAMN02787073_1010 [Chryseobacterium vrystaatense]